METELEKLIAVLSPQKWYNGKELDEIWGTKARTSTRKYKIKQLVKQGMLQRKGITANTQYKKVPANKWGKKNKTPNKKQKLTPLDELINAATNLGTENETLKQILRDIRSTIDKALEKL